jgi:hypothetical protein
MNIITGRQNAFARARFLKGASLLWRHHKAKHPWIAII